MEAVSLSLYVTCWLFSQGNLSHVNYRAKVVCAEIRAEAKIPVTRDGGAEIGRESCSSSAASIALPLPSIAMSYPFRTLPRLPAFASW